MEQNEQNRNLNMGITIKDVAQYTSMVIAITVTFTTLKLYIFYVILLHLPIFQYIEPSDIFLMAPEGIWIALYFGSVNAVSYLSKIDAIDIWQKVFFSLLLYAFMGLVTYLGYKNDPVIEQLLKFAFRHWKQLAIPGLLYIIIQVRLVSMKKDFFSQNPILSSFILCVWFGLLSAFANYDALTQPSKRVHFVLKLNSGTEIITDQNLIYAGKSRNYWFVYNKKTKFIRAIKSDEVKIADFDTVTKD